MRCLRYTLWGHAGVGERIETPHCVWGVRRAHALGDIIDKSVRAECDASGQHILLAGVHMMSPANAHTHVARA